MVKEIEFLEPARVTVAATRRRQGPPGARGGRAGVRGLDTATLEGKPVPLKAGEPMDFQPGDKIRLATPGGGGWGRP